MNKSTILILVAVLGGLFALLKVTESTSGPALNQSRKLFEGVDGEQISGIRVVQGKEDIEVSFEEGQWVVPSRNNYPANPFEVRALLLKVLDLEVSQRVTNQAERLGSFGLDDGAVEAGKAKVILFDKAGGELGTLYVGENRKGKVGQYIRKGSSNQVYLINEPMNLFVTPSRWLDTNITNILKKRVVRVSRPDSFELKRKGPELTLIGAVPEGKQPSASTISLVSGALENVRFNDVYSVGAEGVQDLDYDAQTNFLLKNGLLYQAETAEKDGKYYLRFTAELDSQQVEALEEERKALEDEKASEDEETDNDEASAQKQSALKLPGAATAEDVAQENKKFSQWVYEVPKYIATKYRKERADLLEEVIQPTKEETKG